MSLLASYTIEAQVVQPGTGASLQPQPDAGGSSTAEVPPTGAFYIWVPVLPEETQYQVCVALVVEATSPPSWMSFLMLSVLACLPACQLPCLPASLRFYQPAFLPACLPAMRISTCLWGSGKSEDKYEVRTFKTAVGV